MSSCPSLVGLGQRRHLLALSERQFLLARCLRVLEKTTLQAATQLPDYPPVPMFPLVHWEVASKGTSHVAAGP